MLKDYSTIIGKAKELSRLIKSSEASRRYNNSLSLIRNDRESQLLLEKLILIGNELNNKIRKGENPEIERSMEMDMVKKELEKNSLVKKHIVNQKEYLNLIEQVLERIRNPINE